MKCGNFSNVIIYYSIIFYWLIKKKFPPIITLKSFISTVGKNIVCILFDVIYLQMTKETVYFFSWKLGSISKSKYWFCLSIDTFDWYLFQLIVLLKPNFNYFINFTLSLVDIGTAWNIKFCISYCKCWYLTINTAKS